MKTLSKLIFIVFFIVNSQLNAACSSSLDVGGKSIVNIGETIDGTSAISYKDSYLYFPVKGNTMYLHRYLSPPSLGLLKAGDAFLFCYSLLDSDFITSEDGKYYLMNPDIPTADIVGRNARGDGWKILVSADGRHLVNQAVKDPDTKVIGTLVSEYGKTYNGDLIANMSSDNYGYRSSTMTRYQSLYEYEGMMYLKFSNWDTPSNTHGYFGSENFYSRMYHNYGLYTRCSK